jgi:hypothetical protein
LNAAKPRHEWIKPTTEQCAASSSIQAAGGRQEFQAPFAGDAVLYLRMNWPAQAWHVFQL